MHRRAWSMSRSTRTEPPGWPSSLPARRGRGVGRRALHLIAEQLAADGMREVFGGTEANNVASIRCLESAGFTRRSQEPDAEGFLYFARQLNNTTL
jgi:L-amino acid N-acyltransferase YncA